MSDIYCKTCGPILDEEVVEEPYCPKCGREDTYPLIHELLSLQRRLQNGQSFNGLTPAEAERLHYLIEECGEVIQAAGKVLRHGYECTHPDGGPTNREQLTKELGQLSVATRMMWLRGDYTWQAMCDAQEAKYAEIGKYLHHNHFTLRELRRGK